MRIAFLGTPEIGAIVLQDLLESGLKIEAVITQPDRPCGRGCKLQESAVKKVASASRLKIFQPANKVELTQAIKGIKPDLCIVAAYGMMIPNEALSTPKYGMINFHPSLLPELRGPSPIPMAIMCGHAKTGVTIIQISEKMDAGDILAQEVYELTGKETTPGLSADLAQVGSKMLLETIIKIADGAIDPKKQDEKGATFSPIIKKSDGEVLFKKYHAQNIEQAARAFTPWPGIFTTWKGKKLNLFDIFVQRTDLCKASPLSAGRVALCDDKIAIGTKKGTILVGSLQLEGKKRQTAKEFVCGHPDFINSILG